MTISVDLDLRGSIGVARDQGTRPTCLVFAASAAHEATRSCNDHLSTEYLYFHGVHGSHKDPTRGLTEDAVRGALRDYGQPFETAWPYLTTTPDPSNWGPPNQPGPVYTATLDFASRSVAEVQARLQNGSTVLLVLTITAAMYLPDGEGIVRHVDSDTEIGTYHALLAVGQGHADDGEYILVRNSWGTSWGLAGYGWLHTPYVEANLHTTAVVV